MGLFCCCRGNSSKRKGKSKTRAPDQLKTELQNGSTVNKNSNSMNYNWQSIERAAAITIQSNYRRYREVSKLHDQGRTTALMRNRLRSSTIRNKRVVAGEDVPDILRFCGVGFVFGDATAEYDYNQRFCQGKETNFYS